MCAVVAYLSIFETLSVSCVTWFSQVCSRSESVWQHYHIMYVPEQHQCGSITISGMLWTSSYGSVTALGMLPGAASVF
jgi:hypothetical protein